MKSLFSQKIMFHFFERNCQSFFKADKLISLKIFPKKRIARNVVILYELFLFKNGKKLQKNIWGKTMKENQFKLLKFLAKTRVSKYLPNYFKYLTPLKFSLSEEMARESVRTFEKNFSFWEKNIARIGQALSEFQKIEFPEETLQIYTKNEEKKFLQCSLKKIKSYSFIAWGKYKFLGASYIKNLFSQCWKNSLFSFSHFDFQPSNLFYDKKGKNLKVLDFDFARKFHPALDLANFWVHFYVMSRYYFSKEKTFHLCDKFLQPYLKKSKFKKNSLYCFDLFRLRAIIDIAQMTAAAFKKPSQKSKKVFEKLDEISKIISI